MEESNMEKTIARINELSRKMKASGLTAVEQEEQRKLRRVYLDAIKASLRNQLNSIEFTDE